MFYVVSKQFLSGYVPMQIASSVEEGVDLIQSIAHTLIVDPMGSEKDEAGNTVFKFAVGDRRDRDYYSVTRLLRS